MSFFDKFRRQSQSRKRLTEVESELTQLSLSPAQREALQREGAELRVEIAFEEMTLKESAGAAIEVAHDRLKKLDGVPGADADPVMGTIAIIDLAIHHGAPIYNDGSHTGCAYIYDYAGRMILRLLDRLPVRSGRLPEVATRLGQVSFAPISPQMANRRAWELRHAFDDIVKLLTAPQQPKSEHPETGLPPSRTGRLFISHATEDKAVADRLVALLEESGVPCWIAPRDIPPGSNAMEAIAGAIRSARIGLVLLSSNANKSSYVSREIERAVTHDLKVIPVRIENVEPRAGLELLLSSNQWVDLWDGATDADASFRKLVNMLTKDFSTTA